MRGGAINELQCKHPFEQNLHATGQDGAVKGSAFYSNYAGFNKGAGNTCGASLAGWPQPDYGRLREGPFAPDLYVLRDIGVDIEQLQGVVDKQFNLHSASYPGLLRGGRLRPFVLRCFASMLMYYTERCVKNATGQVYMIEMREVSIKLIASLREKYSYSAGGMANGGDPDLTLRRWAAHVRSKYDQANLPITSRQETGVDANIIVGVVQGLGGKCLCPSCAANCLAHGQCECCLVLSASRALLSLSIWLYVDDVFSCAGTVSNLAQGMSQMQLELQRVRGAEDLIRENERQRLHIRSLELRLKSLEDEHNVPAEQRFAAFEVPSTPHHQDTHKTPDSEYWLPS